MSESEIQLLSPSEAEASNRASQAISAAAASYAIVGGAISFGGWVFDLPRLTDWNNEGISMFANTAACAVLSGMALLLVVGRRRAVPRRRIVARILAVVVAVVGALTLFEHLSKIDLGIDTLLSNRSWGQRAATAPMRMGPPAAISYLVLGVALLLATDGSRARRIATTLGMSVLAIASLSIVGYWFGADQLFGAARYTAIAWQTTTMLAALGIGVMGAIPEHGIGLALRRDDAGGTVLRRLIVPIIGIPLLLGWFRLLGQQAGLYDMAFGTAVRTVAEIILLFGLLWWTANGISRLSRKARQAEQALRESEQRYRDIAAAAKDADRRKDEFLATLAHELRNPLAPIGNAMEIMKHAGEDRALRRQAGETMERQFGHMVRLVDDLLDVSRITRDKLELRTTRIELASVVHQAVETCRSLAEGLGHLLHVDVPESPIWVHGDPVRLAQVFSNLLNNACKFTEHGGKVSLVVEPQGDEVAVSVTDTGIGIAPDQVENIFEMFQQVDQSLERTRGGLGIGLTLVKRLVELHGGRISVRSGGAGRGSQFIVQLPVLVESDPPAAKRPTPGASGVATQPQRILVIDDNRDAARSLAMLLQLNGHEVETVHDGRRAIELAEAWKPDLMLLVLGMPQMNGYDVCRTVRQTSWGKNIRIVALTGWGQDQDRRSTREAGFDDHLVKPVDANVLSKILAAASAQS